MVFEADGFDRGRGSEFIHRSRDTVVPNAPSIVVVAGDVTAFFDFRGEGFEIALHVVIEMTGVDIRPIEVLIGEERRGVVREHPMHHDPTRGDLSIETTGDLLVLLLEGRTCGVLGAELLCRTVVERSIVAREPRIDEVQNLRLVDRENALRKITVENADLDHGAAFRKRIEEKISAGRSARSFGEQAFDPVTTRESGGRSVHGVYPLRACRSSMRKIVAATCVTI